MSFETSHLFSPNHDVVADFESVVGEDKLLKVLGETAMLANVGLQTRDAVVADDEPQLQGPKAAAEGDSPVLKLGM